MATSKPKSARQGSVLIYGLFGFSFMLGMGVLAVDFGRTQVVKSQIQAATDSAVRAAGQKMVEGASMDQILAAAVGVASSNVVDGQPVVVRRSDVKIGVYDLATRTFTETSDLNLSNAIRIKLKYQFGVDGPELSFANICGQGGRTVTHRATVMVGDAPAGWNGSSYTTTTPGTSSGTPDTVLTETNIATVFAPPPSDPTPVVTPPQDTTVVLVTSSGDPSSGSTGGTSCDPASGSTGGSSTGSSSSDPYTYTSLTPDPIPPSFDWTQATTPPPPTPEPEPTPAQDPVATSNTDPSDNSGSSSGNGNTSSSGTPGSSTSTPETTTTVTVAGQAGGTVRRVVQVE